jgi:excisionase family DNA binding protein
VQVHKDVPVPSRQLLTTRQAAKRLGVDQSTVWRLVERGRLEPALRLDNRQMLFDPADIEALRRERTAS